MITKKEITWGTPHRIVKVMEMIPDYVIFKKRKRIKYCNKTKNEHVFVEDHRSEWPFYDFKEIICFKCKLCGKKKYEETENINKIVFKF
jgi:hypothetical protein